MLALGQVGPPGTKAKEDENVIRGLTQAVQVLCDPTPLQQEMDQDVIQNKGRIICLTTVKRSEVFLSCRIASLRSKFSFWEKIDSGNAYALEMKMRAESVANLKLKQTLINVLMYPGL